MGVSGEIQDLADKMERNTRYCAVCIDFMISG